MLAKQNRVTFFARAAPHRDFTICAPYTHQVAAGTELHAADPGPTRQYGFLDGATLLHREVVRRIRSWLECKIELADEKPCATYTGMSVAHGAIGGALGGIIVGVGVSVVVFGPSFYFFRVWGASIFGRRRRPLTRLQSPISRLFLQDRGRFTTAPTRPKPQAAASAR